MPSRWAVLCPSHAPLALLNSDLQNDGGHLPRHLKVRSVTVCQVFVDAFNLVRR